MGIVHVTSVHPPDDIRIFHKECESLARAGYLVSLIVPVDSAPTMAAESSGVAILTVQKVAGRSRRIFRTLPQVWRAMWRIRNSTAVFHFHDPELMPVAVLVRIILRKRVIFDAHEDFPLQILGKYWIPRFLRRPASWAAAIMKVVCTPFISRVVAATPAIAAKYPKRKTVVVQNFPVVTCGLPRTSKEAFLARKDRLVYLGGISRMQGAIEILRAFERARTETEIEFTLCGKFENLVLENEVRGMPAWNHVKYMGWQSRAGVNAVLEAATIGVVIDHPSPNYLEGYSTKMFEYMMAGIPFVCSNFPLWEEIVGDAHCGVLVDPMDVGAAADAIVWLVHHKDEGFAMGQRGRRAVERQYNWRVEQKKLLRVYERLTGPTEVQRGASL